MKETSKKRGFEVAIGEEEDKDNFNSYYVGVSLSPKTVGSVNCDAGGGASLVVDESSFLDSTKSGSISPITVGLGICDGGEGAFLVTKQDSPSVSGESSSVVAGLSSTSIGCGQSLAVVGDRCMGDGVRGAFSKTTACDLSSAYRGSETMWIWDGTENDPVLYYLPAKAMVAIPPMPPLPPMPPMTNGVFQVSEDLSFFPREAQFLCQLII
jgi:hypothetical protein